MLSGVFSFPLFIAELRVLEIKCAVTVPKWEKLLLFSIVPFFPSSSFLVPSRSHRYSSRKYRERIGIPIDSCFITCHQMYIGILLIEQVPPKSLQRATQCMRIFFYKKFLNAFCISIIMKLIQLNEICIYFIYYDIGSL